MSAAMLQRGVLVLAVCVMSVASAGTALAHVQLERSEPRAGERLSAAPDEVFLRFTGSTATDRPTAVASPADAASRTAAPGRATVPWWPFALLLGVAALVGVTMFRRR